MEFVEFKFNLNANLKKLSYLIFALQDAIRHTILFHLYLFVFFFYFF